MYVNQPQSSSTWNMLNVAFTTEQAAHPGFSSSPSAGDDVNHDYINLPTIENVLKDWWANGLTVVKTNSRCSQSLWAGEIEV